MKNDDLEQELHLYRLDPAPEKRPYQAYIASYVSDGDITHFFAFLRHYENRLNTRVMGWVAYYEMRGHFLDLKQAAVLGMLKALARYDISRGVDFLVYANLYIKNEMDDYIRTMRTGFTVQSNDAYRALKKAMAIYNQQHGSGDETVALIAAEIGKSAEETADILAAGLRSMNFADFYRRYADDDDDETAEDVTRCDTSEPYRMYMRMLREETLLSAYGKLDYRERSIVAARLGFCLDCLGTEYIDAAEDGSTVQRRIRKQAYADIAIDHTLSSPSTAERIYRQAIEKMRKALEEEQ